MSASSSSSEEDLSIFQSVAVTHEQVMSSFKQATEQKAASRKRSSSKRTAAAAAVDGQQQHPSEAAAGADAAGSESDDGVLDLTSMKIRTMLDARLERALGHLLAPATCPAAAEASGDDRVAAKQQRKHGSSRDKAKDVHKKHKTDGLDENAGKDEQGIIKAKEQNQGKKKQKRKDKEARKEKEKSSGSAAIMDDSRLLQQQQEAPADDSIRFFVRVRPGNPVRLEKAEQHAEPRKRPNIKGRYQLLLDPGDQSALSALAVDGGELLARLHHLAASAAKQPARLPAQGMVLESEKVFVPHEVRIGKLLGTAPPMCTTRES